MTEPEVSKATVEAAVRRYFAAIAARDADAWADNFADGGTSRDPVGTPPHQGREALRAFQQSIFDAFTTMDLQPLAIHVAGREAAVPWRCHVATGDRSTDFEGVNTYVVSAEGKIEQAKAYWDMEAVQARLGNG
jgi:steroid delta-isomerase